MQIVTPEKEISRVFLHSKVFNKKMSKSDTLDCDDQVSSSKKSP